jgi:hypothetical protein
MLNHDAIYRAYPNVILIDDSRGAFDANGNSISLDQSLVDAAAAELKAAEPMRLLRRERDRLIAETDWWVLPDRTPTDEQLAYRQALRNLPDTATPVLDSSNRLGISGVTWPTKP